MKYLQGSFTVGGESKEYSANYERVFGARCERGGCCAKAENEIAGKGRFCARHATAAEYAGSPSIVDDTL